MLVKVRTGGEYSACFIYILASLIEFAREELTSILSNFKPSWIAVWATSGRMPERFVFTPISDNASIS